MHTRRNAYSSPKRIFEPIGIRCVQLISIIIEKIGRNFKNYIQVIFSDEKKFNLDGPDGWNYYWRDLRKNQRFFGKRNFGGGSLWVWGAINRGGRVALVPTSTRMDSSQYQQVLSNNSLPYLNSNGPQNILFQQEYAPIHVSRSTRAWFAANNVTVMDLPPVFTRS